MAPKIFPLSSPQSGSQEWQIALACFGNMFCVGTVYALSALQVELPRLLGVNHSSSFAPFGAACIGLSVGVSICASLVAKYGSVAIMASGTALWGIAVASAGNLLTQLHFRGLLVSFMIGGVGVGLTYLAVVVLVSQSFPNQPLARSAIGPLGFSSGTSACIAMYKFLEFNSMGPQILGKALISGGLVCLSTAAVTGLMIQSNSERENKPSAAANQTKSSFRLHFSVLLFFNALPGMTVFAALLPGALNWRRDSFSVDPIHLLCFGMAALTMGGFLAPAISSRLGANYTFITLFYIRGLMLMLFSRITEPSIATATLLIVLFGHGTGFSVLPGLLKSQSSDSEQFIQNYGRILISWGVAGAVAVMINASFTSSLDGIKATSSLVGAVAILSGLSIQFKNIGT